MARTPNPPLRRSGPWSRRRGLALGVLLLAVGALGAQRSGAPTGPDDPPSPAEALGYGLGERFTDVSEILHYLSILDAASERVVLREYGRTPGDLPLVQLVLSSPGTLNALDEVLDRNRELTDPNTDPDRAREIARSNPAVVYLTYGIHGDEGGTSEAAIWTAWDLARDAPSVSGVLDSLVVVIDPVANPDGRRRYVEWYRGARGAGPDPSPLAPEHREPWPGGRYNQNLFDLNRDWAWMTQPETRARLETWEKWNPQVHVDFHEMVETSTYFFFPPATPINPIYPDHVLEWGRRFGAANAEAFDRRGWPYFTRSEYDLFYPGYGDSWPSLLGAVGMTYEQAGGSSAGLTVERPDGSRLTLRERAHHHRVASHATLRAAMRGRRALLEGFAETHRTVDEGLPDILLVPGDRRDAVGLETDGEPGAAYVPGGGMRALVRLLRSQGIRVERAEAPFEAHATPHPGFTRREAFPRGTLRIPARQTRGRLGSVLLRPDNPLDGGASYDITAWSLPYAYGVEAHSTHDDPEVAWMPVTREAGLGTAPAGTRVDGGENLRVGGGGDRGAPGGYLVRPGFASTPGLVDVLEDGETAWAILDPVTLEGHSFPHGVIFVGGGGDRSVGRRLARAGFAVDPGNAARLDSGPPAYAVDAEGARRISDLLGERGLPLRVPRVALLGGPGTDPTAFGAHRYFLKRTLGLPVDVIPLREVGPGALGSHDVAVVPTGPELGEALGPEGLSALGEWVRHGGVVVASADAARGLAGPLGGVTPPSRRGRSGPREAAAVGEAGGGAVGARDPDRWRTPMSGVVLEAALDPGQPLAFGASARGGGHRVFVLSSGHAFDGLADGETVAGFPAAVNRVSGWAAEERLRDLSGGTWLVDRPVGRGRLVLFADDPLFRHFWYAGFQLVANALLFPGDR